MRAACWGGDTVRECTRHSKIFFHSGWDRRTGPALSWSVWLLAGVCTLCLKPHHSPEPCVMWSGSAKEGSPLDSEEPPLRCSAGKGGQWCKAALGNKQLWLRVWWLLNRLFSATMMACVSGALAFVSPLLILESVFLSSLIYLLAWRCCSG